MDRPSAVITGVSSGIGFETAKELISRGYRVFGSVRQPEAGAKLSIELGPNFEPLYFDVTDEEAARKAADVVREKLGGRKLWCLINNAGIVVGPHPISLVPISELRRQFDTNVCGAVNVTQAFLPLLGADTSLTGPPGRVVNITSTLGRVTLPFLGPYCASKHAMEAVTDSMRREFKIYGVDVIGIAPGAVKTGLWKSGYGMGDAALWEHYADSDYGPAMEVALAVIRKTYNVDTMHPASDVATTVMEAIGAPEPAAKYTGKEMTTAEWLQNVVLPEVLPRRIYDALLCKLFGLDKPLIPILDKDTNLGPTFGLTDGAKGSIVKA